ncbi:hypothetical protein MtrunA17_Chr3g0085601 [Medicago truncatula]|uniref:Putative plant transposon protein domain-containing protein n=1 Tax=Medicago truncatula TaxID=3880 RepID=A0A396IK51_MEDTR|nr:hypothetical protein MtrunA17_Chr3g0085601 [Medicago truncatula]
MEFFANAVSEKEGSYESRVRGKLVDFSPQNINRILGIPVPPVCDVERRRLPANWPGSQEEWDGLLVGLMKEGTNWIRKYPTNNPQRIDTADLLPIPRAWASFVLSTIVSTSAAAEMILSRVFILLVLFSVHEQMNVGKLIAYNINDMLTKNTALGHCCLINLLCQDAGVSPEPANMLLKSQVPITDSTMARLEKKVARTAPPEAHHHQHRAPPQEEYPPMHPALAEYIYTSANWMDEASSQLYIEPPRFSQQFAAMQIRYKKKPGHSYERFGSRENMENYFRVTRERAGEREQDIREDYTYGENLDFAGVLS